MPPLDLCTPTKHRLNFSARGTNPSSQSKKVGAFSTKAQAAFYEQRAYKDAHPTTAIYRVAAEGSQTRDGGVIQHGTSRMTFVLADDQRVNAAQLGDYAVYPDGTQAQIVTASGQDYDHVALVGSRLCNGDEIINTPQGGVLLLAREGVPPANDFLPAVESMQGSGSHG